VTDVKPSRTYSSPARARQAAGTRAAVLAAARELFVEQGYGATTVDQIAARAGVSKPTVFTAVGSKQTVLSVVRDVAMAGDDEAVAVSDRPAADRIRGERDPHRTIELLAAHVTEVNRRYAQIDEVLRGAAQSGEPDLRRLWQTSEEQRLIGARMWLTNLAEKGPLRDGLDLDTAVDLLWFYMAPGHLHELVHERGWPTDRYRTWLTGTLARTLLPESA
jgi:AcrR family transcriptional regulator